MPEAFWLDNAREWQRIIDEIGPHDFYQRPFFAFDEAERLRGSAIAFCFRHDDTLGLIPLILRPVPNDKKGRWLDAASPYGYPGILTNQSLAAPRIIEAYHRAAHEKGILSSFIRLHPIQNTVLFFEREWLRQSMRGKTYSVYLPAGYDPIRAGYSSTLRRDLRQLEQAGYHVEFAAWDLLEAWHAIYTATMRRLEAREFYHFDLQYFQQLREEIAPDLVVVRDPKGQLVCGGLFTRQGNVMQYHLSGTRGDAVREAPTKLMLDAVIRREAESGKYEYLHLGGGLGAREDGLARFKRRFANREHWFRTLELIHDARTYKTYADGREDEGYFPLYRAPRS